MKESTPKRGGARKGAGRPALGKKTYAISLTEKNVAKAKKREKNFSGLLDRLLTAWLESGLKETHRPG